MTTNYDAYYAMMGTSAEIEAKAETAARALGWEPNTHMEGYSNPTDLYWMDGVQRAYDNMYAKTWKQLCEDEGISYC